VYFATGIKDDQSTRVLRANSLRFLRSLQVWATAPPHLQRLETFETRGAGCRLQEKCKTVDEYWQFIRHIVDDWKMYWKLLEASWEVFHSWDAIIGCTEDLFTWIVVGRGRSIVEAHVDVQWCSWIFVEKSMNEFWSFYLPTTWLVPRSTQWSQRSRNHTGCTLAGSFRKRLLGGGHDSSLYFAQWLRDISKRTENCLKVFTVALCSTWISFIEVRKVC
jgi:hypothetical protein